MTESVAVPVLDDDAVPLAHHFDDPEQQHQSALLGMWAFLATEVMFFGGMITAYAIYRSLFPAEFAAASRRLSPMLGAVNTLVLLGSSLAIALAVRSSQLRKRGETVGLLAITMALGTAFLGIKAYEWWTDIHEHLLPGRSFDFGEHGSTGLDPGRLKMFFVFYFSMTGLHGFHMIIGLAILAYLAVSIHLRRIPAVGERPVEITGLYWHFVDIVWVFLYPLLYLIDVHR